MRVCPGKLDETKLVSPPPRRQTKGAQRRRRARSTNGRGRACERGNATLADETAASADRAAPPRDRRRAAVRRGRPPSLSPTACAGPPTRPRPPPAPAAPPPARGAPRDGGGTLPRSNTPPAPPPPAAYGEVRGHRAEDAPPARRRHPRRACPFPPLPRRMGAATPRGRPGRRPGDAPSPSTGRRADVPRVLCLLL